MDLFKQVQQKLFIGESVLIGFAKSAPLKYKVYEIQKRNGKGTRTIAHPSKELKYLQRLIIPMLREVLPIHKKAYAYESLKGIKQNAELHKNSKYLLKLDFQDFFPSIEPKLFFNIFKSHNLSLSDRDEYLLSHLLFRKKFRGGKFELSIGAPSSPFVSNAIMFFFDKVIDEMCIARNIDYSRYADDLTFTTNTKDILFEIPKLVEKTLKLKTSEKIKINSEKTVFSSKGHNRHITGITLTNQNTLSIGRDRKRLISSMVYRFNCGLLTFDESTKLKGLLGFAKHIEPKFIERLIKKYGHETIAKIQLLDQSQ